MRKRMSGVGAACLVMAVSFVNAGEVSAKDRMMGKVGGFFGAGIGVAVAAETTANPFLIGAGAVAGHQAGSKLGTELENGFYINRDTAAKDVTKFFRRNGIKW